MAKPPFGLGRGLDALIPSKKQSSQPAADASTMADSTSDLVGIVSGAAASTSRASGSGSEVFRMVRIDLVSANPHQPRTRFAPEELDALADSIVQHGLLQPLVVTQSLSGFELVSGERRLRAAKIAGLTEVPVVIRTAGSQEKLELAIIENIQREDLDPIERAQSYQVLLVDFGLTQEQAAKRLGIARSVIANTLRYLELPLKAQDALREGKITEGHAKILASLETGDEQKAVLETILEAHYTVRETETVVRSRKRGYSQGPRSSTITALDPNHQELLAQLREALATKVEIQPVGEGGKVVIYYYSPEELRQLVQTITQPALLGSV